MAPCAPGDGVGPLPLGEPDGGVKGRGEVLREPGRRGRERPVAALGAEAAVGRLVAHVPVGLGARPRVRLRQVREDAAPRDDVVGSLRRRDEALRPGVRAPAVGEPGRIPPGLVARRDGLGRPEDTRGPGADVVGPPPRRDGPTRIAGVRSLGGAEGVEAGTVEAPLAAVVLGGPEVPRVTARPTGRRRVQDRLAEKGGRRVL